MADAEFIVQLRTDPERNRFLHATSTDVQKQEQWISEYLERPDEYYFIIQRAHNGEPVGTIGLYDFDRATNSAEWGRWVTRSHSGAGSPGLLLLLDLAFQQIGIQTLYCHTIVQNTKARAIFEGLGFEQVDVIPSYATIGSASYDGVKFRVSKQQWLKRLTQETDVLSGNSRL